MTVMLSEVVVADAVLALQTLKVLHEPPAVGLKLGLRPRPGNSAPAEHQRVEMTGEAQEVKPAPAVGPSASASRYS